MHRFSGSWVSGSQEIITPALAIQGEGVGGVQSDPYTTFSTETI